MLLQSSVVVFRMKEEAAKKLLCEHPNFEPRDWKESAFT
jgi:hypothetical protein